MIRLLLIAVSVALMIGCSNPVEVSQASGSFDCIASGIDCKVPITWEIRNDSAILTVKSFSGAMLSDRIYITLPERIKSDKAVPIAVPDAMIYNNNNRCFGAYFYIDGSGVLTIFYKDLFKTGKIEMSNNVIVRYKL